MPLTPDGYDPSDSDELFTEGRTIHESIDSDANLGQGTVRRAFVLTVAQLLADNQEQALDAVYDAGYVSTASDEHLERRAADFNVTRQSAVPATGVVEFFRDSEASSRYTIQTGTIVETLGDDPVAFQTTTTESLGLIDGFEAGTLDTSWNGDTGSVSVVDGSASGDPDPDDGTDELELDATSGTQVYDTSQTLADGDTLRVSVYPEASTVTDVQYFVGTSDQTDHYLVRLDASSNTVSLVRVDGGTETQLDSASVTVPTGEWTTVVVDTGVNTDTAVDVVDASKSVVTELSTGDDTYNEGYVGLGKGDTADQSYVDTITTTATAATIEASAGGSRSNVGPRAIEAIPNTPAGISGVENPVSTGDPSYVDTSGTKLVVGQDRETDEELRERIQDRTAIGGAGTVGAVGEALRRVEDVISVKVFENDTLNDNTGSGGLPPVSVEIVVYGGGDEDIANAIFETTPATERLYAGAHGTSQTFTITSDLLDEDETVEWSEPAKLAVDVTLDLVVDDSYVGDSVIKDTIAEYIGGTLSDGSSAPGTGIAEDVRISALRDRVVGPDTGVRGISAVSTTPSTTTGSNGLTIVDVADDEVAQTDATDGSITLKTTVV